MDMKATKENPVYSIDIRLASGKWKTVVTSDQFKEPVNDDFMADTADAIVRAGGALEAKVYDQKRSLIALVDSEFYSRD